MDNKPSGHDALSCAYAMSRLRHPRHPGLTYAQELLVQRRLQWRLGWLLVGVGLAWAGLLWWLS